MRKRNYKREWKREKERNAKNGNADHEAVMRRQKDRREFDKENGGNTLKKSPKRTGKDISHAKKGAKGKYRLEDPSTNRARNYRGKKKKT